MGQRMHCRNPPLQSPENDQQHGKSRNDADASLARMTQGHGHMIVRAIPAPSDRVNHNHAPRMGEYQHGSRVAAAVRSDLHDM
jgi:hypothetical protein